MREKIFRGKRKDNGKWAFGDLLHLPNGDVVILSNKGYVKVIPETVGEFTNLPDKNGKKIFEGDVLCRGKERYTVIFDDYCRYVLTNNGTRNYLLARNNKDMEVIGNIYDSPELLEVGV